MSDLVPDGRMTDPMNVKLDMLRLREYLLAHDKNADQLTQEDLDSFVIEDPEAKVQ